MTYKEVIKLIEDDGWYLDRQKGSHRQYKHPVKNGLVTIAHHGITQKVAPKMLNSIMSQAQIEIKR